MNQLSPSRAKNGRFRAGHSLAQSGGHDAQEPSVRVAYVTQFDNIETVKRAVEIDSGVAILPEETIRGEVAN